MRIPKGLLADRADAPIFLWQLAEFANLAADHRHRHMITANKTPTQGQLQPTAPT
jgi:hypothetical protein